MVRHFTRKWVQRDATCYAIAIMGLLLGSPSLGGGCGLLGSASVCSSLGGNAEKLALKSFMLMLPVTRTYY